MIEGIVVKAVSGAYFVDTGDQTLECSARGVFRKNGESPLVGDRVEISVNGDRGVLERILPRRNSIVRPPVANIDRVFIVSSMCVPAPNTLLIDRELSMLEKKHIEPVLVFNKADGGDAYALSELYERAGYMTAVTSCLDKTGIDGLRALLVDGINVFTGNSGVGKSSLLNLLLPDVSLKTGEVSQKLGRGRHTTRTTELFVLDGKYIADTAGFSSFDLEAYGAVLKEELPSTFREFEKYAEGCRFADCSHTCEAGCAVLEAVKNGEISESRHKNYRIIYDSIKDIEKWELKKREPRR